MATAPASEQSTLLELQEIDTRISQAVHRRDNLPLLRQLTELTARAVDMDTERMARAAEVSDINRDVDKADDDVSQVRARFDRDTARLNSGEGTPKDLQALQSELEILTKRVADLEEVELEVMERLEQATAEHQAATKQYEAISGQIAELERERDVAIAEIEGELTQLHSDRDALANQINAELLSLYEKLRSQHGGTGAAALRGSTCEGCHMTLNPVDVNRIKDAPADQVVRCEECGRILVRSGAK